MDLNDKYRRVAEALKQAKNLIITAGAGMGVDSGLPDFRGDKGFWNAYPMYERLGINFIGAANPVHFADDPAFGWGFYGHRTNLYRETVPHPGFGLLKRWAGRLGLEVFIVTSNVDGQFQKAGFGEENILEVHGSIHHLQCLKPCSMAIWPNREEFEIDFGTMRSRLIPSCSHCGDTARPNVLMFGDSSWVGDRTRAQEERFETFLDTYRHKPTIVLEMGAGTMVPTIRHLSENLGSRCAATVVRINPREAQIAAPHISLPVGARQALQAIEAALDR